VTQVDGSPDQTATPIGQDRRRAAEAFFRKAFLCVLVWAIFWALLAAASAGRGLLAAASPERLAGDFPSAKLPLAQWGNIMFGISGLWGCVAVITFLRRLSDMTSLLKLTANGQWMTTWKSAGGWLIAGVAGCIVLPVCSAIFAGMSDMKESSIEYVFVSCFVLIALWLAVSLSVWHLRIGQLCGMAAASGGQRRLVEQARQVVRNWRIQVAEVVGFPAVGYFLLARLQDPMWFWLLAVIFDLFFVYCLVYLLFLVRMTAEALSEGAANGGKP